MFYNVIGDVMENIVFHIDVNNAFLSWTAIKLLKEGFKKDIRNVPSVIGGDESKRHGVVLAKSIPAKKMGVKTAETLYNARKKCPNIEVYPPNMSYYKEMSKKMREYISKYSPDIESFSIDEVFVDFSHTKYLYKDYIALANEIREGIKKDLGFTVNIGVGNNKLCAKMASDFEKPDKVHTLFETEIEDKLWPLPIEELFMVGSKTAIKLKDLRIKTIGDLANYNIKDLIKVFKNTAVQLQERARGIDSSEIVTTYVESKSISTSETLEKDCDDPIFLKKILMRQAEEVGRSLRKKKLYANVIAVTFKTKDFQSFSRQVTLTNPISFDEELIEEVLNLFYKAWNFEIIRNIGMRVSHFQSKKEAQLSLFSEDKIDTKQKEKVQEVVDSIKEKYGSSAIQSATLAETKRRLDE